MLSGDEDEDDEDSFVEAEIARFLFLPLATLMDLVSVFSLSLFFKTIFYISLSFYNDKL